MKSLKFLSILFLLLHATCYMLHAAPAFAAVDPGNGGSWVDDLTPQKLEEEIKSGVLSKETSITQTVGSVLPVALVRMIGGPVQEEADTQGTSYRPGGAIGGVTNLIVVMYANPPASGVDYLADLGRNLGIVSPAYAQQGVGFGGLSPILPIWKAFRNIAYLFFIIIFIATGFAIMFRMKISPQAVMTIQSAIPRVVIALILVTFSYAIAGFLIDLMYVALTLGIAALGAADLFTPAEVVELQEQFISGGFPQVIGAAFKATGGLGAFLAVIGLGGVIGAAVGAIVGSVPTALIGVVAGVGLFALLLFVIILYCLMKLFLELLKTYIGIIFGIILAPLQIMLGVLPGQSGFGKWLMGLLANIMVFPAVAIFLLLARLLMNKMTTGGDLWTPPMLGLSALTADVLPICIALGFLLMVHKIPEMVKQAFGQKPLPYGAAIGEALGPGKAIVGFPTRAGLQYEAQRVADLRTAQGVLGPRERVEEAVFKALQMIGKVK